MNELNTEYYVAALEAGNTFNALSTCFDKLALVCAASRPGLSAVNTGH
jgi:hypothetical protein